MKFLTSLSIVLTSFLMLGCESSTTDETASTTEATIQTNTEQSTLAKTTKRYLETSNSITEMFLQVSSDVINNAPSYAKRSLNTKERYTALEIQEFLSQTSSNHRGLLDDVYVEMDEKVAELKMYLDTLRAEIQPEYSDALNLPYVIEIKKGVLLVNNEFVLDALTTEGAMNIELLNSIARGEDIDALLDDVAILMDDSSNERGFVLDVTKRWDDNTVIYKNELDFEKKFISTTAIHHEMIKGAMKNWEDKTNVHFERYEDQSRWDKYLIDLGLKNCATYVNMDLQGLAGGMSYIGVGNVFTTKVLIHTSYSSEYLMTHELGHLLGLMHEHQRGDRDEHVVLPENYNTIDPNYLAFDLYIETDVPTIVWKTKESCFLGICKDVSYPANETKTVKTDISTYTEFDYHSIMLYSAFTTKKDLYIEGATGYITSDYDKVGEYPDWWRYSRAGSSVGGGKISTLDAQTVNTIYPQ